MSGTYTNSLMYYREPEKILTILELDLGGQILCQALGELLGQCRPSEVCCRMGQPQGLCHSLSLAGSSPPEVSPLHVYGGRLRVQQLGCQSMALTVADFQVMHFYGCWTCSHQMWNLLSFYSHLCWAYELFCPIECNVSDCVSSSTES